jgi:hypothetical protein
MDGVHTREIALGIAAATVIVAGGLVLLARAPSDAPAPAATPRENLGIAVSDAPAQRPGADAVEPHQDAQAAAAKVRELEAMSETFRNTTFVIAIRDAGYVCNQLLRVYGGIDDSGKWTATCSEMLAYTVAVTGNGSLRVEPFMQYFDGLAPGVIQQFNDTVVPVPPPAPPQDLPQPR